MSKPGEFLKYPTQALSPGDSAHINKTYTRKMLFLSAAKSASVISGSTFGVVILGMIMLDQMLGVQVGRNLFFPFGTDEEGVFSEYLFVAAAFVCVIALKFAVPHKTSFANNRIVRLLAGIFLLGVGGYLSVTIYELIGEAGVSTDSWLEAIITHFFTSGFTPIVHVVLSLGFTGIFMLTVYVMHICVAGITKSITDYLHIAPYQRSCRETKQEMTVYAKEYNKLALAYNRDLNIVPSLNGMMFSIETWAAKKKKRLEADLISLVPHFEDDGAPSIFDTPDARRIRRQIENLKVFLDSRAINNPGD